MSNKIKIKVYYKSLPKYPVINEDITKFKNYNDFRDLIIKKSNEAKQRIEIKNVAVQKNDKFINELEEKISGIDSIYDEKTFSFFMNKVLEIKPKSVKVIIVKVDKYPEWKPPQVYKILEGTLKSASKEVIDLIKKDLTQEDLENGGRIYIKEKKEEKDMNDELYKEVHANVFCNNCQNGNFFGLRYICAECHNFNLCENCYSNEIHKHCQDHTFIRIKEPINIEMEKRRKNIEISEYDCIFAPNRKIVYKPYETFDLEVDIINNGMNDLCLCFISPIRFGKKYLGCGKTSVSEQVNNGEKFKMNILVKFEDEVANGEFFEPLKEYEGYFRLMTPEGVPFGDILYLKVVIRD